MSNSLFITEDKIVSVFIEDIKSNARGQTFGSRLTRDQIIEIARKDFLADLFLEEIKKSRFNSDVKNKIISGYKRIVSDLEGEKENIESKQGILQVTAFAIGTPVTATSTYALLTVAKFTLVAVTGPGSALLLGVTTIGASAIGRRRFNKMTMKKNSDIRSIKLLLEKMGVKT